MAHLWFRKTLLFCFVLFCFINCQSSRPVISGCAQTAGAGYFFLLTGEENEPNFAEIRPRALRRDELTVVFSGGEIELDFRQSFMASEAQLFTAIYEGLFTYHPGTMQPVPALAERWALSEDRKQWTFTIRQNARFWNGDPVRAEDFRASWLSLICPQRNSPYSSLFDIIQGVRDFRNGLEKDPETVGIIAEDSITLIVRLNAPAAFFPAMLCHHSFAPIHHSMIDREDWAFREGSENWTPPMSNGPFRISAMDRERIILSRNDYYWAAALVSLNKITIIFAEDGNESAALWNSGQAQWIAGNVNFDALTDRSGIQVTPIFATHYYFIRSAKAPWNDYRIRRALVLALPWDEIRQGHFLPATTLVFPIFGQTIAGLYITDIDESMRLLAEAGFSGGCGLPELVIRITPSHDASRIAGIMASNWERLGVSVRTEVIPFEHYLQSLAEDGYDVGLSTWIGNFVDPYTFLQKWRKDSNLNTANLNDSDFEELMERSMFEEGAVRFATLAEAEQLLLDRGTVLPISHSPAVNIVDLNELAGWYPNILSIHPFRYISFRVFSPLPGVAMAIHPHQ